MQSRYLTFFLLLLLVMMIAITAVLGVRVNTLQQEIQNADDQHSQTGDDQSAKLAKAAELSKQLEKAKGDLAAAKRTLQTLTTTNQTLQQQHDDLTSQLQQAQAKVQTLQQTVDTLQKMNDISKQVIQMRGLSAHQALPRTLISRAEYRKYLTDTLDTSFPAAD